MSISSEQIAFATELFDEIGPLTTRKMMGGLCLYSDGIIFAMVHPDGKILVKGAGDMAEWMTAQGWQRWSYTRKGGKMTAMPYWELPEAALDDPEAACDFARRALAAL